MKRVFLACMLSACSSQGGQVSVFADASSGGEASRLLLDAVGGCDDRFARLWFEPDDLTSDVGETRPKIVLEYLPPMQEEVRTYLASLASSVSLTSLASSQPLATTFEVAFVPRAEPQSVGPERVEIASTFVPTGASGWSALAIPTPPGWVRLWPGNYEKAGDMIRSRFNAASDPVLKGINVCRQEADETSFHVAVLFSETVAAEAPIADVIHFSIAGGARLTCPQLPNDPIPLSFYCAAGRRESVMLEIASGLDSASEVAARMPAVPFRFEFVPETIIQSGASGCGNQWFPLPTEQVSAQ